MPGIHTYNFPQSYDTMTKALSAVVCTVFLIAILVSRSLVAAPILLAIMLLSYAWSPRRVMVREGMIAIHRLIGTVHIPLAGIREARTIGAEDLCGCLRLWGNGGLFGYYGLFRTSKLGKCWWYVTRRKNMVVVKTAEKTVLLSPDDVRGFLAAIRTVVPDAIPLERDPLLAASPEAPARSIASLIVKLIVIACGVAGLAMAVMAFWYAPGPPRCTLTAQSLTIHDRFYPVTLNASAVDVEHMRVVSLCGDSEWRPRARTNGFANSHYQSGWFRAANGKSVRLYSAGAASVVLLPPVGDNPPVLLDARDPVAFMEQVRQAWAER